MITMSPIEYMSWLVGVMGMKEEKAKEKVEKLYLKQQGIKIKLFLRPFKNELIWDYLSEDQGF